MGHQKAKIPTDSLVRFFFSLSLGSFYIWKQVLRHERDCACRSAPRHTLPPKQFIILIHISFLFFFLPDQNDLDLTFQVRLFSQKTKFLTWSAPRHLDSIDHLDSPLIYRSSFCFVLFCVFFFFFLSSFNLEVLIDKRSNFCLGQLWI